jgi:hypothetical protein
MVGDIVIVTTDKPVLWTIELRGRDSEDLVSMNLIQEKESEAWLVPNFSAIHQKPRYE